MNILIIHNEYSIYGGENKSVESQRKLLCEAGYNIYYYSKNNKKYKDNGILSKLFMFFNMIYSIKSKREISEIIVKNNIDIVMAHNLYPLISPSVLRDIKEHNIPIIMALHNYRLRCPNGYFMTKGRICERCAKGNNLHCVINNCKEGYALSISYAFASFFHRKFGMIEKYVDMYISPSQYLKNQLASFGLPRNKIKVIPHFLNDINDSNNIVGEYALFVGRMAKEKGIFTLVKVFAKNRDKMLKIVGDGEEYGKIKKIIDENKLTNIELLGFKSGNELEKLYKESRFVITPSECYEAFGLTVIEAFSYKKPVLGSNIGAIPELVKENYTGWLFKYGNIESLSEKLNEIWADSDRIKRFGENGYKYARENFSKEQFLEKFDLIVKELRGEVNK